MQGQLNRQMEKQDSSKVDTYGAVEGLESQRVDPENKEWHRYGSPTVLLMSAGVNLGQQCAALAIILMSVHGSHEYLLSCDSRKIGLGAAAYCEYSKAYVRCFPLLALVVSLMVAVRQILQHRMYYELLKHGVLQDIENFSPMSDPLFLIVIWCALNAGGHFALALGETNGQTLAGMDAKDGIKKVAAFYFVPTALFFAFLYTAYDLEYMLLPLSKYFEEDPADARRSLGQMPFLDEPATAAAVKDLNAQESGPSTDLGEAVRQITKLTEAKMQEAESNPDAYPALSRWRLMGCLWPSEFLLHRNREDGGSTTFKHCWYLISVFCLFVIIGVLYFFIKTTVGKFDDVRQGQTEDLCGILVTFAFAKLTFFIAIALLKNITVPFRI